MALTEEEKKVVKLKLESKGVKLLCPMCGNNGFIMADGYMTNIIHTKASVADRAGQEIRMIPIICNNCGFLSQHVLRVLGRES